MAFGARRLIYAVLNFQLRSPGLLRLRLAFYTIDWIHYTLALHASKHTVTGRQISLR
jgi:hypothetical protein